MNEMAILGKEGDTKVIWDPQNKDEIEAAKTQFDLLINKSFLAFKVLKSGEQGSQIRKFDPKAGKIIMVPPVVGG